MSEAARREAPSTPEIVDALRCSGNCWECLYYKNEPISLTSDEIIEACDQDRLHNDAADRLEQYEASAHTQAQNEPLTLEQIKARKWVWIDNDTARRNKGWAKVFTMYDLAKLEAISYSFSNYGKTWLAYDYEPKGAHQ
ncbi:MAG: hypothetical protein EOM03_14415 [Clostridia bacterium]|nr:hypothetical protein [Clostridia bacterium]